MLKTSDRASDRTRRRLVQQRHAALSIAVVEHRARRRGASDRECSGNETRRETEHRPYPAAAGSVIPSADPAAEPATIPTSGKSEQTAIAARSMARSATATQTRLPASGAADPSCDLHRQAPRVGAEYLIAQCPAQPSQRCARNSTVHVRRRRVRPCRFGGSGRAPRIASFGDVTDRLCDALCGCRRNLADDGHQMVNGALRSAHHHLRDRNGRAAARHQRFRRRLPACPR